MRYKKNIVMLGTSIDSMGGISAVVKEYRGGGLFDRFPIVYLPTHADGDILMKLRLCIVSWLRYTVLLVQGRVALIHVHTASATSFWRKALFFYPAFLFRVPSILHLHGGGFAAFYESGCNRFEKTLVRHIFDRVDSVVVLSDAWRRWVQGISANPRILPICNPVRMPPLTDFECRDAAAILCLGRLGNNKGTYDLLLAASRLMAAHPNLQLWLGGDGELERAREEAERLGIGANVQILGWVSGKRKSALLERAAIYVLPSYAEGLPMSVLEAMAAGLPVVSTTVGGIPEVITDGQEGYLIQPGDLTALSNALGGLLADESLRRRMGKAGRIRAESTFSTEHVLPHVELLYQGLVACPLRVVG